MTLPKGVRSFGTADEVADGGALRTDVLGGEPAAAVPQELEPLRGAGGGELGERGERSGEEALEELKDEDPAIAQVPLLRAWRSHVHEFGEVSRAEFALLAAGPLVLEVFLDPTENVRLLLAQ